MPKLNQPYKETNIGSLTKENIKVAISGVIVNQEEGSITLDDGTGNIPILINTELSTNTFVKVYGILIPMEQGYEIQGHLIQDISEVNQKLHKKIKSLLQ